MDYEHLKEIQSDEDLRKRIAKWMTEFCFRNAKLEDFHDRLNQDEMKAIMIDSVNHSYLFLSMLFCTDKGSDIIRCLKEKDPLPQWNDPELPNELLQAAARLEGQLATALSSEKKII